MRFKDLFISLIIAIIGISPALQSCSSVEPNKDVSPDIICLPDQHSGDQVYVHLSTSDDQATLYLVSKKDTLSKWPLYCPVIKLDTGDANADGHPDLLVMPVKPTRRDSTKRPRPFLYEVYKGHLRPLWLGSWIGSPMLDFRVTQPGTVRFLLEEPDSSTLFMVADFKWRGFSPLFDQYRVRNADLDSARSVFEND